MEEKSIECHNCSKEATLDVVKISLWRYDRLVIVEDVPAYICQNCGEQYYSEETEAKLTGLTSRRFPKELQVRIEEVPVYSLNDIKVHGLAAEN